MAENEMSLIMRIRTLFDGKGTKEAVDNLSAIGTGATDMGKKTTAAAGSAEKAFAAVNAATQVTEGGVMGVATATRNLAGQFPKLAGALGPLGLVIAAFAAWKKAYDDLKGLQKQVEQNIRSTQLANLEGEVRRVAAAYEEYGRALAVAEDNRKRLSDAEASKDDARLAADLAKLDLAQAEAASKLTPDDQFGRRRLDLDTASQRSALTDAAALRKSDRELANITGEGRSLQAQKSAAQQNVADLTAEFSAAQTQLTAIMEKIQAKSDAALTPAGKQFTYMAGVSANADTIARLQEVIKKIPLEIAKAMAEANSADSKIYTLSEQAEVNRMNRSTQLVRSRTGGIEGASAASALNRDIEASRERDASQLQEESAQKSAASLTRQQATRGVSAAERNLRTARNSGADSGSLAALKAELDKALAARAEADRIIIDNARRTAEQANRTAEAVKNLPNN